MIEWFASHSGVEQLFLLSGIVGGMVLILRLILTIAGLDHHGGFDAAHLDSDGGFQLLTIQGISSFFSMFGVVGYMLYHSAALGLVLSLVSALAAGAFSLWVIHKIFRSMLKLQSSGTVSLFAAVGSEGSVYLTVTKEGGSVQINFANRLREFEAVSADGATLPTGTAIRVQGVAANTLIVSAADR
jgi:membrane protein implicated in regulation of membrane protease activity